MQGSTICGLEGPSEVSWLSWHPRGSIVVAGSEDGTIWMWNAQTGQCGMHRLDSV
jgi:WD40 repeat protein